MPTLVITRGLPGSGKTTWAKGWLHRDPLNRARVNRDDLRSMVHDGVWSEDHERQIQMVRDASIRALLKRGIDVVVDDTNLPSRTARDLRRLAVLEGAEFQIEDFTNVPLDECLLRNGARTDKAPVPEEWIRTQYLKFISGRPYPLPLADESEFRSAEDRLEGWVPYEPDTSKQRAILVDIDGTIALMGDRSAYDEARVHEDRYNETVIEAAYAQARQTNSVLILVSGRSEKCREATEKWIVAHERLPTYMLHLYMRPVGDMRKDADVKYEIFNNHIRNRFNVISVWDDRNQVVKMWRAIGLTVFQVADGDF